MTGAPRPDSLRRTPAAQLSHPCPRCHAQPGERCTSPRGRTLRDPHPSRTDTAERSTTT